MTARFGAIAEVAFSLLAFGPVLLLVVLGFRSLILILGTRIVERVIVVLICVGILTCALQFTS